jgi:beta-1,4-mannosyl-glycoprotein beta-1,4-N-acetylglucosaminyltransferase
MIYDVFTFFNELDLLEIRFKILNEKVDRFVLIECTETFSGKPKPLIYSENKHLFKEWEHKIIHHITDNPPSSWEDLHDRLRDPNLDSLEEKCIQYALTTSNIPPGELHWLKEFYQKECIKKALVGLDDNDICFVGDLDEVWNPDLDYNISDDDIYKLRQLVYTGYMNVRSSESDTWAGTMLTKYKNIKDTCLNHLRTTWRTPYQYIDNAGWHFTFMGGPERIKTKLESYGHQEYNNKGVKDQIEYRLKNNMELLGRSFSLTTDEERLPEYLKNNKDKYKHLFK